MAKISRTWIIPLRMMGAVQLIGLNTSKYGSGALVHVHHFNIIVQVNLPG